MFEHQQFRCSWREDAFIRLESMQQQERMKNEEQENSEIGVNFWFLNHYHKYPVSVCCEVWRGIGVRHDIQEGFYYVQVKKVKTWEKDWTLVPVRAIPTASKLHTLRKHLWSTLRWPFVDQCRELSHVLPCLRLELNWWKTWWGVDVITCDVTMTLDSEQTIRYHVLKV